MEECIKQAIEDLKYAKTSVSFFGQEKSLDLAIQALQKQLSKKVEEGTDGGFDWHCSCGTYLSPTKCDEIKYCINCGQKLDWE